MMQETEVSNHDMHASFDCADACMPIHAVDCAIHCLSVASEHTNILQRAYGCDYQTSISYHEDDVTIAPIVDTHDYHDDFSYFDFRLSDLLSTQKRE